MKKKVSFWRGMASVGALTLSVLAFGTNLAFQYTGAVNSALKVTTSKIVREDENADTIHLKSEFGDFTE